MFDHWTCPTCSDGGTVMVDRPWHGGICTQCGTTVEPGDGPGTTLQE